MQRYFNTKHGTPNVKIVTKPANLKLIQESHVKDKFKYDFSYIESSTSPICNKNSGTKTEVCENFQKEYMENIDNNKDQTLSVLLTPEAMKSFIEHDD